MVAYPHTTCLGCKLPMLRTRERIDAGIRKRCYECPACGATITRVYSLPMKVELFTYCITGEGRYIDLTGDLHERTPLLPFVQESNQT